MRQVIYIFTLSIMFSCKNFAQNSKTYDRMPLDTTKWSVTETLDIDFNYDGVKDVILVFDKYKALTRPDNMQTPVLFYLGVKPDVYSFINKAEKLVFSPYYEFKISDNTLIISQNGIGDDKNIYTNFYKYKKGNIIMFKEIVQQKIEKLKVDDKTGDVTTATVRTDTVLNQLKNIIVDQYNIMKLVQSLNQ